MSSMTANAQIPSLRIPGNVVGARPAALGGAFTALADDQNALFYNPAGLARLDSRFIALADINIATSFGTGGLSSLRNDFPKLQMPLKMLVVIQTLPRRSTTFQK